MGVAPQEERLPIVPATRGLRKNLGEPSSRMPARSVHRDTGGRTQTSPVSHPWF